MKQRSYRKKPMIIQAVQYTAVSDAEKIAEWCGGVVRKPNNATPYPQIIISTLEGDMAAEMPDYIIRGIKGEYYPCKPDVFEASYEEVK